MTCWPKEKELELINQLQDEYVDELVQKMQSTEPTEAAMKFINFTSPTGTGKTKMMAKLINKLSNDFFIITTLSKGQLNKQVAESIQNDCLYDNYIVFGVASLKTNTILTEKDIIKALPNNKNIYWVRDEGHINANKWSAILENRCVKIINFSAANKEDGGIKCNFTNTLMLRTVNQQSGTIEDALNKLIEIKNLHKAVKLYNPCALFRVMSNDIESEIIKQCDSLHLQYITLVDNNDYRMADLCKDDNEYDVIINKQKMTEGIDIRRAHVLWMENQPSNQATTIQAIGRCRRNALLWRNDIDILQEENKELLKNTRECFVYYNVKNMKIDTDETGELAMVFCPYISVERLKSGHIIHVEDGKMPNGLIVAELMGCTGNYKIMKDSKYGFNRIKNPSIYKELKISSKLDFSPIYYLATLLANPLSEYSINFRKACENDYFGKFIFNRTYSKATYYTTKFATWGKVYTQEYKQSSVYWKMYGLDNVVGEIGTSHVAYNQYYLDRQKMGCLHFTLQINKNTVEQIELTEKEFKTLSSLVLTNANEQLIAQFLLSVESLSKMNQDIVSIYNNDCLGLLSYDSFQLIKYGIKQLAGPWKSDLVEEKTDWIPQRSITAQLARHSKLNRYIESQYNNEIEQVAYQLYPGKNNFQFTKKMNSCLGYCVEFYAKYLLWGEEYLAAYINKATNEFSKNNSYWDPKQLKTIHRKRSLNKDAVIIRACMMKYRDLMYKVYPRISTQTISSFSYEQLSKKEMKDFIDTVVNLGTKAAKFCKNKIDAVVAQHTDPILQTAPFVGLVDLMDQETIIDIKCTNHIDLNMIKQVLAYQFLSLFRSDLHIKQVIVYDAVADKFVKIQITEENQKLPE